MLDYEQIGKQVKIARINAKITQECLAEQIGVTAVHISNIERGATKVGLSVLVAISKALQVSLDVLVSSEVGTPNQRTILNNDIFDLLDGCTPREMLVIKELIESTKKSLRRVYSEVSDAR